MGLVAVGLVLAGCSKDPQQKIRRWATQVEPPADAAAPPSASDTSAEPVGPPASAVTRVEPAPRVDACDTLIDRACKGLGPFSEECRVAKSRLPPDRPPEWRTACAQVVDTYKDLLRDHEEIPSPHPCWRLMRRKCKVQGFKTFECRQVQSETARLTRRRNVDPCIGDLLLFELEVLLSGESSETGR